MSQHSKPYISTSFSYETLEETLDIKPQGAQLHIGIPKETAFQENRIALTPEAVGVLVSNGHNVVIEHNAGEAAHFRDRDYSEAGAKIVYEKAAVFKAPILVKSAPVVEEDLPHLQFNQVIISPIHLSAMKAEFLQIDGAVSREENTDVDAEPLQLGRQRADDVSKPACLGKRKALRGEHDNAHGVCHHLPVNEFARALSRANDGFDQGDAKAAVIEFQNAVDGATGGRRHNVFEFRRMLARL